MRALERRLRKQDAVVGDDAHRVAPDPREAADQRGAVARLEFVEFRAIDEAGDDLAHVVGLARVGGDHAVQFLGGIQRRRRLVQADLVRLAPVQVLDDVARQGQRVVVVLGEVVGHAGQPGVNVRAAQVLGADFLAGGGLHQRRAAQEDGALVLDDD
ncbi:hypothetical protein D3C72_1060540 [compost metagenome]